LEKDHLGSPDLIEAVNLKKLENLKDAVSNGTYAVRAEDLAPKLWNICSNFYFPPGHRSRTQAPAWSPRLMVEARRPRL
jgi:hypothetical protein